MRISTRSDNGLILYRFIRQVLDGCTDPLCSRPACLNYRRRTAVTPLRPFTRWTARGIALFFASSNESKTNLCPTLHDRHAGGEHGRKLRSVGKNAQRKDPKSFMQHLVNTRAVKAIDGYDIAISVNCLKTTKDTVETVRLRLPEDTSSSHLTTRDIGNMFMAEWDGRVEVALSSTAGLLLRHMCKLRNRDPEFLIHFRPLATARHNTLLDLVESWVHCGPGQLSLLNYSWLFTEEIQIQHFRALCFYRLSTAAAEAKVYSRIIDQLVYWKPEPDELRSPLRMNLLGLASQHLFMEVSRNNMLADTFDQLWRREPREFWNPIKVRILNEGEEGQDLGGVATEFFKVVLKEIFSPEYSM